jgi:hypothetical protein
MTNNVRALTRIMPVSLIAVMALGVSNPVYAAESAAPISLASIDDANTASAAVMARIKSLHDQLRIMPGQEAQWSGVARVMRRNATAMTASVQRRELKAGKMTAIDDLRSYQAIVASHAEGLKRLAAAFAPLYSAMPAAQRKNADAVFGHRTASRLNEHG